MRKPSVKCALLAAMIAKHRWGSPIDEEHLLSVAALGPNEVPTARDAFDQLRTARYIVSLGDRGIKLDNGEFAHLAEALYHECNWEAYQIRIRLKHYEGWDQHDWA